MKTYRTFESLLDTVPWSIKRFVVLLSSLFLSFFFLVLILILIVYFQVEEVRSFTAFMAVSSLGGQAGLWMGCSILTVIHAFTYCLWALGTGCTNRIKTIVKKDSVHFVNEHGKLQGEEAKV